MNNLLQSLRGVLSVLIGFQSPEDGLLEKARRREHPEATLSELAELHEPPTSKSTVNHRMRKLLALAAEGTETTEEGPA